MPLAYRWTLTPKELYACFRPVHSTTARAALATIPFACPKRPLEGTPYMYQCAVSDTSVASDIAPIHAEYPNIPLSGDRRAGVIIYKGHFVIASYIISGNVGPGVRQIIVREEFRQQGLGTKLIEQWQKEVPGVVDTTQQPINFMACKTFIRAHSNVVTWAVAAGKPVPQNVRDAVAAGTEAQEIMAKLNAREGAPARSRRRLLQRRGSVGV